MKNSKVILLIMYLPIPKFLQKSRIRRRYIEGFGKKWQNNPKNNTAIFHFCTQYICYDLFNLCHMVLRIYHVMKTTYLLSSFYKSQPFENVNCLLKMESDKIKYSFLLGFIMSKNVRGCVLNFRLE